MLVFIRIKEALIIANRVVKVDGGSHLLQCWDKNEDFIKIDDTIEDFILHLCTKKLVSIQNCNLCHFLK